MGWLCRTLKITLWLCRAHLSLQAWEKGRLLESKSFGNPILIWLNYCLYEITSHKTINFFAKKWSPTLLKRLSQKQTEKNWAFFSFVQPHFHHCHQQHSVSYAHKTINFSLPETSLLSFSLYIWQIISWAFWLNYVSPANTIHCVEAAVIICEMNSTC